MSKIVFAIGSALTIVALAAATLLAQGGIVYAQNACGVNYLVLRGDTLIGIAARFPGLTWQAIAQANNLANPNRILAGQTLCIPVAAGGPTTATPGASPTNTVVPAVTATRPASTSAATGTPVPAVVPTFRITAVTRDTNVTLSGQSFPANAKFTVRMGAYGTQGVGGAVAGELTTSATGTVTGTVNIPAGLRGASRIAIRLDGPGGYYSYNWFWNQTATVP
jgi:LysM repeat protein